jgi:hypothetical protein
MPNKKMQVTEKELTNTVLDNYSALHRPIAVKEKGSKFMQGTHGIILKPQDCYMDLIGPFKDPEDFWKICDERFKDQEFMVVPHLKHIGMDGVKTDGTDEPFVWKGNYSEFITKWELD